MTDLAMTRRGFVRGALAGGCCALAGDAAGNAQSDSQGAADGARFHSIYDGTSPLVVPFFNCLCCLSVALEQRRT